MSVPLQHLQCLVPGDHGDFHGVEALLKEAGGGLVAEIVEAQIINAPQFVEFDTLSTIQGTGFNDLLQQLRQVFRSQMRVPFQHLQCLVSGDGRHLHGV